MEEVDTLCCTVLEIDPSSINSCNANLYDNDGEALAWHSDDEPLFRKSEWDRDVLISGCPLELHVSLAFAKNKITKPQN